MKLTKHWAAQLDDYVIDLAWADSGSRLTALDSRLFLAAASAAGPISIFAGADGARQHELPGHDNGTNALAWMPVLQRSEGRGQITEGSPALSLTSDLRPLPSGILATGGQDGAVKFWDAATGQHTATASLGRAWVEHLAWKPKTRDQKSEIGNQIPPEKSQIPGLQPLTSALCPPPSDSYLAAAAGREFVFLNPDGSVRHAFPPAPKTISAIAWHPQGGCVACSYFGGVCLWDADDFIAQKELAHANGLHALVWSPDGQWLVSGNQDASVHLWLPEKDQEFNMSGYEGKVKHLSFDHTSRWLATSGGHAACVWDCSGNGPEGREPVMLPHDAPVCALTFQKNRGLLATASQDGNLVLWSPERKQPLRATVRMPSPATKLAWSPDDQLLAVGAENGSVFVLKCQND
jgi:WD40 repeat protein